MIRGSPHEVLGIIGNRVRRASSTRPVCDGPAALLWLLPLFILFAALDRQTVLLVQPAAQIDLPAAVAAERHGGRGLRIEPSPANGTSQRTHRTHDALSVDRKSPIEQARLSLAGDPYLRSATRGSSCPSPQSAAAVAALPLEPLVEAFASVDLLPSELPFDEGLSAAAAFLYDSLR